MLTRRLIALASLLIWLLILAFLTGPVRSEYAHTYAHRIQPLDSIPVITNVVGLRLLGLGRSTFLANVVVVVMCGVTWIGPIVLLVQSWRVDTREMLSDWLLYGGLLYATIMGLFLLLVAFSLWLPFSLMS